MESLLLVIALSTFAYLLFTIFEFAFGFNLIKNLSHQPTVDSSRLPTISVIVSALNEEEHIENALISLMSLDYPQLEVIAINDRSTDKTADILDNLKQQYPHLQVHHIRHLPEGWFGKNHALHFASQQATGDWLLFTDADVVMKKDTLLKAMSYAIEKKIDHLTIYEHHHRHQFWLKVLLLGHYVSYSMAMKPWRIRYSWSKRSVGHGAFNLINKQAYQQFNGHRAIAMECLDDLKLGEFVKKNGFRQDIVDGRDFISREWYSSVRDMISGMEKNSFAYYNYRMLPFFRDLIFAFICYFWPLIALCCFSGPIQWVNALNICLTLYVSIYVAKKFRLQKRYALFYPAGVGILIYIIWNSAFSIYKNNGVKWRGTHYPLQMLRRNKSLS